MAKQNFNGLFVGGYADAMNTTLPDYLKVKGLYDGTAFPNDVDACSIQQESVFQATGSCVHGILSSEFAKALCRAEMIARGVKNAGAYGCNATQNAVAEWTMSDVFSGDTIPEHMQKGCIVYTMNTKKFSASVCMASNANVTTLGYGPFIFSLWGLYLQKIDGFEAVFDRYVQTTDPATKGKLACKLSQTIQDFFADGAKGSPDAFCPEVPKNPTPLNKTVIGRQIYLPERMAGDFEYMGYGSGGTGAAKIKKYRKTTNFVGAYKNPNRVLTEEENSLVPKIGDDYVLPKEVVTVCHLIANTRDGKRPMTNIMLRGDPSVGKTAGARAIAAGLNLPYTFVTCNAGTEMYNLIGDMMPVDADASNAQESINAELFKNLPSATDISMDPVSAYKEITGKEKPDATEVECMVELFRKQMTLCADACKSGFRYVESPLVRAIRNGWVCELQEPSLITRPAVMPGLNGLLDETGCIVLPTGEMLHRHPDAIIISTLNVDLEGCRPLNQSFIDRHHVIMDMECPSDDVIANRIKGMTGCSDTVPLTQMVKCMHQIAQVCAKRGATDGNTNSMRSLANWVEAYELTGDIKATANWTVVSGATADPDTRNELRSVVANYNFS